MPTLEERAERVKLRNQEREADSMSKQKRTSSKRKSTTNKSKAHSDSEADSDVDQQEKPQKLRRSGQALPVGNSEQQQSDSSGSETESETEEEPSKMSKKKVKMVELLEVIDRFSDDKKAQLRNLLAAEDDVGEMADTRANKDQDKQIVAIVNKYVWIGAKFVTDKSLVKVTAFVLDKLAIGSRLARNQRAIWIDKNKQTVCTAISAKRNYHNNQLRTAALQWRNGIGKMPLERVEAPAEEEEEENDENQPPEQVEEGGLRTLFSEEMILKCALRYVCKWTRLLIDLSAIAH